MTDGVDAAAVREQPAAAHAVLDRARPEAGGAQLREGDQAALPRGDRRHRSVRHAIGEKPLYLKVFSPHAPEDGGAGATGGVGAQSWRRAGAKS